MEVSWHISKECSQCGRIVKQIVYVQCLYEVRLPSFLDERSAVVRADEDLCTFNLRSFCSWACSIFCLSWKLRNFTRTGLGPALESSQQKVGQRLARSISGIVGKFSREMESAPSWSPTYHGLQLVQRHVKRLEDQLQVHNLFLQVGIFFLQRFEMLIKISYIDLDWVESLFKQHNLPTKCRRRSLYRISTHLDMIRSWINVGDRIQLDCWGNFLFCFVRENLVILQM